MMIMMIEICEIKINNQLFDKPLPLFRHAAGDIHQTPVKL